MVLACLFIVPFYQASSSLLFTWPRTSANKKLTKGHFSFLSTISPPPCPGPPSAQPRPNTPASGRADPFELRNVTADSADHTAAGDASAARDRGTHASSSTTEGADVPAATGSSSPTAPASTGRDTPAESAAFHPAHDTTSSGTAAADGAEHH